MSNVETVDGVSGDQVEYLLVRQLVGSFLTNQVAARRGLHGLLARSPTRIIEALYRVLMEESAGGAEPFILGLLAADEGRLTPLVGKGFVDFPSAVRIAKALSRIEPSTEAMLLRCASRERETDVVIRVLGILEEFSDCSRISQQLQLLARHPNENIRSKAARLVTRTSRDKDRLSQLLADADPRVRSNAAETFFENAPKPGEIDELWRLAEDSHHRPATTALAILALHGDSRAVDKLIEFINSADPHFQVAAAWAMGRAQNPGFLPVLQLLIREQSGSLKRMAMRSCALIRKSAGV